MKVKRAALAVGINNYPGSPLFGAINDAKSVTGLLSTNEDGSANFEVLLEKDCPTREKLWMLLTKTFSRKVDIALFYFSGHGSQNAEGTFLVTPDTRGDRPGIAMPDLMDLVNNSPAANKVIILDCCHSGAAGGGGFTGGMMTSINHGVTILTSSRENEPSGEKKCSGVFTSLLLDALQGGAADITGHISPGSVYAYIDQSLGPFQQRPLFKTNVDEFITLRKVYPKVDNNTLCRIVDYFANPGELKNLDPSYEATNDPRVEHALVIPYAIPENVAAFKHLQKLQSVGLVVPVDEPHMYFAAMRKGKCRLTALGRHYWDLVSRGYIY